MEPTKDKHLEFIVRIKCKCDITYRVIKGKHHCDAISQLEKKYKVCEGLKNNSIWSSHTVNTSIYCYENEKVNVEIVRFK